MNELIYELLDKMNEGIILIDEDFKICFWNHYVASVTEIPYADILEKTIYEVLPRLDKSYFRQSMQDVLTSGCMMFFSAAIHPNLLSSSHSWNLKISRLEKSTSRLLMLEFINVTNQAVQISQLKGYVSQLYDTNKDLQEKEQFIRNLAYYDTLTGIANRTLFYKLAEKQLEKAHKDNHLLGLLFIDVNKFKMINDTYGHDAGDKVLMKVADILKNTTRQDDIVARYGGDEFLILLPTITNPDHYREVVNRIHHSKDSQITINGEEISISLSIGLSMYPNDGNTLDKLILKADESMYRVKRNTGIKKHTFSMSYANH